ncbi:MAG: DNA-primase RepB domain-containing protein [Telluria sp.]
MKGIAWLKRMNARGNNILIQPDEESGVVLVSKLARDALVAMSRVGFEPAVTVETRPGAFQAWVRLTTRPTPANALLMASEGLARRFAGEADTAGYLAGFTVHDTPSESQALRPFALAHEGRQGIASFGAAYMAKVAQELHAQADRSKQRGQGRSR